MKLSTLYLYNLSRMDHFIGRTKAAERPEVSESFQDRADSCRSRAADLAHCIAKLGDLEVNEIDFKVIEDCISRELTPARFHWLRGLELARDAVMSSACFYLPPSC